MGSEMTVLTGGLMSPFTSHKTKPRARVLLHFKTFYSTTAQMYHVQHNKCVNLTSQFYIYPTNIRKLCWRCLAWLQASRSCVIKHLNNLLPESSGLNYCVWQHYCKYFSPLYFGVIHCRINFKALYLLFCLKNGATEVYFGC